MFFCSMVAVIGCHDSTEMHAPPQSQISDDLNTGIPVVRIESEEPITSDIRWENVVFHMADSSFTGRMRGRGNTTWHLPKKPYVLKFEQPQEFLNLPKGRKWVLLANYRDQTLMRNAFAFEMAKNTSLSWTPSCDYVELVLNGAHQGNYLLCEGISLEEQKLGAKDIVILEFDRYYNGKERFLSKRKQMPVNIKESRSIQVAEIEAYIDTVECILYDTCSYAIEDYLNLESFADYFLVYEVMGNSEIRWPKSAFMNKKVKGKLNAGPVWDFDWNTFTAPELDATTEREGFRIQDALWYDALLNRSDFRQILSQRWKKLEGTFEEHRKWIDSTSVRLRYSWEKNFSLWPIDISLLGDCISGDENMSLEDAAAAMKKNLDFNIKRTDSLIKGK